LSVSGDATFIPFPQRKADGVRVPLVNHLHWPEPANEVRLTRWKRLFGRVETIS
jgi:hypothetical protein